MPSINVMKPDRESQRDCSPGQYHPAFPSAHKGHHWDNRGNLIKICESDDCIAWGWIPWFWWLRSGFGKGMLSFFSKFTLKCLGKEGQHVCQRSWKNIQREKRGGRDHARDTKRGSMLVSGAVGKGCVELCVLCSQLSLRSSDKMVLESVQNTILLPASLHFLNWFRQTLLMLERWAWLLFWVCVFASTPRIGKNNETTGKTTRVKWLGYRVSK